jgi:succinylglutamate desuccinylase
VSDLLLIRDEELESDPPTVPEPVARLARGPRVIAELLGDEDGPTLICVGSLHGNEPAGALALDRFFSRLGPGKTTGFRGRVVGLVGNRQALARGRRYLQHDLNRFWSVERARQLRERTEPLAAEAEELRDLDRELERILAAAGGHPVFLLDLHTTSGNGPAFANLDDTLSNRKFAFELPVPLVVGIEEELTGTLASYLFDKGVITVGFESGQHEEERAVDRAEAAIWLALVSAGVLPRNRRPEVAAARQLLAAEGASLPRVVEVLHRHAIEVGDDFRMLPGFRSFKPVAAGQVVARDRRGDVAVDRSGMILMPLYQEQGQDGYFLVKEIRPFWLKLSEYLRRLRLDRLLGLLPGVTGHPTMADGFTIDRRWARWWALELFHLLGYRRYGEARRYLVMARRGHDR